MAVIINGTPIWQTAQDNEAFLNGIYDRITSVSFETVRDAIAQLVGNAPEALDTIEELAHMLLEHADMYETFVVALSSKVDKIAGKQLSSNDFSDDEKIKLSGLFNYIHPASHSAAMITETSDKKFVTDNERQKIAEAARVRRGKTMPAGMEDTDLFIKEE